MTKSPKLFSEPGVTVAIDWWHTCPHCQSMMVIAGGKTWCRTCKSPQVDYRPPKPAVRIVDGDMPEKKPATRGRKPHEDVVNDV